MTEEEAATKVHAAFDECRDALELLTVNGWHVELMLPTDGIVNTWGRQPIALSDSAGVQISRRVLLGDRRWKPGDVS